MAKATINTKKGTKIVIEGSSEEVKRLVDHFESGSIAKKRSHKEPKSNKRLPSCTDAILELKEERFFDKPKGLADIKEKLESQGMIYPLSSLSGVVLGLVRRRYLGRVKEGGRWCYVTR